MIRQESITIEGEEFVKSYSDANRYVDREGEEYEEAIDPAGSGRTYTEGNIMHEGG